MSPVGVQSVQVRGGLAPLPVFELDPEQPALVLAKARVRAMHEALEAVLRVVVARSNWAIL